MQKNNRAITSQIINGIWKFLVIMLAVLIIIILIIPLFLSIFKGNDLPSVSDSNLRLQLVSIPEEENAYYDLNKIPESIDLQHIPQGAQLVSDYLNSGAWDKESVRQLLIDNEEALADFTAAAPKKFQLPYTDGSSEVSSDLPVTPLNGWREASRLSGVKAIWLANNGQSEEALAEALKSVMVGNAIENSQSPLIINLVGMAIKDNGLDILQKVLAIIPQDQKLLSEYRARLANYRAEGNAAPFAIEYLAVKQYWDNFEQDGHGQLDGFWKVFLKNKFYFKKNLTVSYYFDFYNNLAVEAEKDCSLVAKVSQPIAPVAADNPLKMYFTENAIGKYFTLIPDLALNNVLTKKCATENKLKATLLLMGEKEERQ